MAQERPALTAEYLAINDPIQSYCTICNEIYLKPKITHKYSKFDRIIDMIIFVLIIIVLIPIFIVLDHIWTTGCLLNFLLNS